jgi:DNA-binding LacI/PurR family transcriptional regulator
MHEVGALAAALLLDQLTGVATLEAGARLLPAVLVARNSVGPPPDRKRGIAAFRR